MSGSLQDFFEALKEGNYSVNYYLPEDTPEKDKKKVLAEIQDKMRRGLSNNLDTLKSMPSEFTLSNIFDPVVRSMAEGIANPLDAPYGANDPALSKKEQATAQSLFDLGPTLQVAPKNLKGNFGPLLSHEVFHTRGFSNPETYQDYWDNWSRLTTPGFLSGGEWASKLYRNAKRTKDPDIPGAMYQAHYKMQPKTLALEELAAYIYEGGMKKPKWMSDRDFNIIGNYIRNRMDIWDK